MRVRRANRCRQGKHITTRLSRTQSRLQHNCRHYPPPRRRDSETRRASGINKGSERLQGWHGKKIRGVRERTNRNIVGKTRTDEYVNTDRGFNSRHEAQQYHRRIWLELTLSRVKVRSFEKKGRARMAGGASVTSK